MAFSLFAVLEWTGNKANQAKNSVANQASKQNSAYYEQSNSPNGWALWDWALSSEGDTVAQWVMAFFAIVAAALLWRTLTQTNKTNIAAIRAANAAADANEIMRDEQRPWLQFEIEEFSLRYATSNNGDVHPFFLPEVRVRNHGRSPALGVTMDMKILIADKWSISDIDDLINDRNEKNAITSANVVFPGDTFLMENTGSRTTDFGLKVDGSNLPAKSASILAVLFYFQDSQIHYTAKFYHCRADGLLPRPTVGHFKPHHVNLFDRYT